MINTGRKGRGRGDARVIRAEQVVQHPSPRLASPGRAGVKIYDQHIGPTGRRTTHHPEQAV